MLKAGGIALAVLGFLAAFWTPYAAILLPAGAALFWKGWAEGHEESWDDSDARETDQRIYGREHRAAYNSDDDENAQSGRGGGKGLKQQGVKDLPPLADKFEQSQNPKEPEVKKPENKLTYVPKGPGAR